MAFLPSQFVPGQKVTIRKIAAMTGQVALSWTADVLTVSDRAVVVQAIFQSSRSTPVYVDGVPLERGDHFTEYYFADEWYNIFAIADPAGLFKGWYCNISEPPRFESDSIRYVDLELDLFVHPDGHYRVLDEDEFVAASQTVLAAATVAQAAQALQTLIRRVERGDLPAGA